MFTTSLEGGIINYTDSPLLRAIKYGRIIIIDEADKAPEHVVAIFRSLAGQGEMSLSDGRRVRPVLEREGDIVVHPNFRLILLANRPGYRKPLFISPRFVFLTLSSAFLGNHFLQVLGENFSAHSVSNPDQGSERKLIGQLAPELSEDTILRLVGTFHDLRKGYESGILNYPYSLRGVLRSTNGNYLFSLIFLNRIDQLGPPHESLSRGYTGRSSSQYFRFRYIQTRDDRQTSSDPHSPWVWLLLIALP